MYSARLLSATLQVNFNTIKLSMYVYLSSKFIQRVHPNIPNMTSTRIVQLANSIAANTALVDNYFRANDLPTPSFSLGGPVDFGLAKKAPHVESARIAAIEASIELQELLTGPIQLLRPVVGAFICYHSNQYCPRY